MLYENLALTILTRISLKPNLQEAYATTKEFSTYDCNKYNCIDAFITCRLVEFRIASVDATPNRSNSASIECLFFNEPFEGLLGSLGFAYCFAPFRCFCLSSACLSRIA